MVSVLAEYTGHLARFATKGPAVGLFADQEIRMIDGPLMVGRPYVLRREIVALSESRRTESYWVKTRIHDAETDRLVATLRYVNDDDPLVDIDLGRGQPDPGCLVHRLEHVIDQSANPVVNFCDGFGAYSQPGIGILKNWEQRHCGSASNSCISSENAS